ncbi:MAG: hypothetical protein K8T90_20310 [Planctomycetes bacterium]|nr:hypothetical protein [Planctomycetota bacterium]
MRPEFPEPTRRSVAANGKVIEQEQILTTHNLAVLLAQADIRTALNPHLEGLARDCFTWVRRGLQFPKGATHHKRLLSTKNAAYAWRQMVFFLSLLPASGREQFLAWVAESLAAGRRDVDDRMRPAIVGLGRAVAGQMPEAPPEARRFLGWTTERHWIFPPT